MPVYPLALPAPKTDSIPATPSVAAPKVDYKLGEHYAIVPVKGWNSLIMFTEKVVRTQGGLPLGYRYTLPMVLFGVELSYARNDILKGCFYGLTSEFIGFAAGHELLSDIPPYNHSAWKEIKRIGNPDGSPRFILAHNAEEITHAAMCRFSHKHDTNGKPLSILEGVHVHVIQSLAEITPS